MTSEWLASIQMSAGVSVAGTVTAVVHFAEKKINNELRVAYCVILTIVSERGNKNQQNFHIFCAVW